jgi:hypothetical protein
MHPVHAPTFNATIQNKIDACKSNSIPYGPISKQDSQTVVVSNKIFSLEEKTDAIIERKFPEK